MKYQFSLHKVAYLHAMALCFLSFSCNLVVGDPPTQDVTMVIDSVKYIRPSIKDLASEESFLQNEFRISRDARLMLRYEKFSEHRSRLVLPPSVQVLADHARSEVSVDEIAQGPAPADPKKTEAPPVKIEITVEGSVEAAAESLRLCPLVKPWMMMSSWTHRSPLHRWEKSGSDYDEEGCVQPTHQAEQRIYFDVTAWTQDYFIGRQSNDGLILISIDEPITITGDQSGSFSPRIYFRERIPSDIKPIFDND